MFGLELFQIVSFGAIWFAAAMSPGANVAFTVSVSSRFGIAAGLTGAAGFVSALFLYMGLVAYGLGFAISQFTPILDVLRWVGVAYLLYLAWLMWNASGSMPEGEDVQNFSLLKIYIQGALICLTNPKAIVFIAVLLPQTVNEEFALFPQLFILGISGALISLCVHTFYSILGRSLGQAVPSPRARVIVNRVIATFFVVAAVGLVVAKF